MKFIRNVFDDKFDTNGVLKWKMVAAAREQRVIEMRQTKSIVLWKEAVGIEHKRTNCHNRLFCKKEW